ncbi:MAG: LytR/AlgR family response regulator transcription factor [Chitinophagales bacterium]|jgi:two-component system LytT family response regulator
MISQRFKTVLIDDEQDSLSLLNWNIEQECPELEVVASCQGAKKGSEAIQEFQPDLVFLDIEMPEMNGLQLLQQFPNASFYPVFTTAYSKYAINAIKLGAFDYLLKPIKRLELRELVDRLVVKRQQKTQLVSVESLQYLKEYLMDGGKARRITVQVGDQIHFLEIDEILYAQAESNYVTINLSDGRKVLVARTLKYFDELLAPHGFYRAHASYLVNLKAVRTIIKGESGGIILSNGVMVPISKNRKDQLFKII